MVTESETKSNIYRRQLIYFSSASKAIWQKKQQMSLWLSWFPISY